MTVNFLQNKKRLFVSGRKDAVPPDFAAVWRHSPPRSLRDDNGSRPTPLTQEVPFPSRARTPGRLHPRRRRGTCTDRPFSVDRRGLLLPFTVVCIIARFARFVNTYFCVFSGENTSCCSFNKGVPAERALPEMSYQGFAGRRDCSGTAVSAVSVAPSAGGHRMATRNGADSSYFV